MGFDKVWGTKDKAASGVVEKKLQGDQKKIKNSGDLNSGNF